jgi:ParB-like chromosome segregation protein Spo0J
MSGLYSPNDKIIESMFQITEEIQKLTDDEKIECLNQLKKALHSISPLHNEPVDCVLWVKADDVQANDYNPNSVAPPEMELLRLSIAEDGYTQPIVTFLTLDGREVVDGFHRNRVGKECPDIQARIKGYLPVVTINEGRSDKGDRMAATVRHNRARGKHQVEKMSDIILELKKRMWSDEKIGKHLGMDADEVLRLAQITGLAEMFKDRDFSMSWEAIQFEKVEEIPA